MNRTDAEAWKWLPDSFKTPESCAEAVALDGAMLEFVPKELKTPELCRAAVESRPDSLEWVPDSMKTESMCLLAADRAPWTLKCMPESLRTEAVCRAAVKANGMALEHAPERLKSPALCLEAVRRSGMALQFVPEVLRTPALCMEAVRQDGWALGWVPRPLRTETLCAEAVRNDALAMQYVPDEFRHALALAAVRKSGIDLPLLPEALKTEDVCLEAVRQNAMAAQWIPRSLQTAAFYAKAAGANGFAIRHVPQGMRTPELCMAAVKQNGMALEFVPDKVKTEAMCGEALRQTPKAAAFVPARFKTAAETDGQAGACRKIGRGTEELFVFMDEQPCGRLFRNAGGTLCFAYGESYASAPDAMPLSPRLPFGAEHAGKETEAFFDNLLPEETVRRLACLRSGTGCGDVLGMLKAWGRESAGALQLALDGPVLPGEEGMEPIPLEELYRGRRRRPPLALWTSPGLMEKRTGMPPMASLAGGQDKLPVAVRDGKVFYPLGRTASTHVLKPGVRGFPHSARNEVFCLDLAQKIGLPAAKASFMAAGRGSFALVERYDRQDGRRLHQFDFCQLLGLPPSMKYQPRGKPDLLLFAASGCTGAGAEAPGGGDIRTFLFRSMLFSWLVKHNDAHLKNFSLVRRPAPEGGWRLEAAPLYDVCSMTVYGNVSQEMALSFGGRTLFREIRGKHVFALADGLGIDAGSAEAEAKDMADCIGAAAADAAAEHARLYGFCPVYPKLVRQIAERARNLKQFLAAAPAPARTPAPA